MLNHVIGDGVPSTAQSSVALLLRLVLAIVIFPHGAQKMLGWYGGHGWKGTMGFFRSQGIPAVFGGLAILAEFLGPWGLVLGLFTRVAAFGVAVTMTVAALKVHRSVGFFMNWGGTLQGEGFEFHILAAGIAVTLMILGGGAWSLDALLFR